MNKSNKKTGEKLYKHRLKVGIDKAKIHKFIIYPKILKFYLILFIILFLILIKYHLEIITLKNFNEEIIEFSYFLILDTAIILIPLVLIVINIRKNFCEKRNELKDLRSSLINIRYESSYKLINQLEDEKDKNELLNNEILKKFKDPYFLTSLIINNTISKVRKFNLTPNTNTSYADIFGFIIRCEEYFDLNEIDSLIYEIVKLLKKYGDKDGIQRIEKGLDGFNYNLLKEIKEKLDKKDYDYIRKKLFTNLDWVLIYIHHIKDPAEPDILTLYRKNY